MNGGMIVFHNGTNVSYANHSSNLSSMSAATQAITLRFLGQGASVTATSTDAVVLTVTAGKEEEVMEFIAGVMAKPGRRAMTVIADDNLGIYSHDGITAVSSISVDTGAGTFKNIIVGAFATNDLAVTNSQSGSIITVPTTGGDSTITLPTAPIDGFNARFVCEADSGTHTITVAGAFEGCVSVHQDSDKLDNTTNVVIADDSFKIGDWFEVVYSGTAGGYKISGCFLTNTAIAAN